MKLSIKLAALAAVPSLLLAAPVASAAEPNNDLATATGPLTAGKTFEARLETAEDVDFHFFYVPDPAQVSVTTINAAQKRGEAANRGRTIVSGLLRARKGKSPLPMAETSRTLRPKKRARVRVQLRPGKYFIPVGRPDNGAERLPNVPFKLRINPVGVTTDSYEIFERRCRDAQRKRDRIRSSAKRTQKRIKKAKRNDAPTRKIVRLKLKLREKRAKGDAARRAERFACSIPR